MYDNKNSNMYPNPENNVKGNDSNMNENIENNANSNDTGMNESTDSNAINEAYEKYEDKLNEEADETDMAEKKNKKTAVIVCIAAAVLIVAIAALLFVLLGGKNKDKNKVIKAFSELAEDSSSYNKNVISTEDEEALINSIIDGSFKIKYSFNLDGIDELPTTIGLDGSLTRKYDEKKLASENSVSAMNINISDLNLYASDKSLYLQIGALSDSNFMIADTTTFADDYNSSFLADLIGETLPDECNFYLFPDMEEDEIEMTDIAAFLKDNAAELNDIYDQIEVTHEKEKTSLTTDDGTELTGTIYDVNIPVDAANAILELAAESDSADTEEAETYTADQDIKLKITLDQNGYIREIATDETVSVNGTGLTVDMLFTGAEVETDTIQAAGSYTSQDLNLDYSLKLIRDTDGAVDLKIDTTGDAACTVTFSGARAYDSDTGILACNIERLEVDASGDELFHVSGTCTVQNADNEVVTEPTGDVIDLMNMDLGDLLGLASDLENNSEALSQIGELFGL